MVWQYWCAGVTGIDAMGRFMHAMWSGMAILIIPPFFVTTGFALMAWRRRDTFAHS